MSESAMNAQERADTRIVAPARLPFAYQDALNAGEADAVVALFHQDATMSTFAGKVLTGQEALHADWDLEAMLPDLPGGRSRFQAGDPGGSNGPAGLHRQQQP